MSDTHTALCKLHYALCIRITCLWILSSSRSTDFIFHASVYSECEFQLNTTRRPRPDPPLPCQEGREEGQGRMKKEYTEESKRSMGT